MGNSSSSARHQQVATPRPSSSAAKQKSGKDQLPPMTTAGRKSKTTTSPSVNVAAVVEGQEQGTEVLLTMDEPHLMLSSSCSEEDEEEDSTKLTQSDDVLVVLPNAMELDSDDDDLDSDDDDDDDDSLDEYWAERQAILADAKALAQVASWYSNPSQPVVVDGLATARCYFDRPSAVLQSSPEDEVEFDDIMKDVTALKQSAGHFMHPERPVMVDATACVRNYFDRVSASPYEDVDEDEDAAELAQERDMILKEAAQLKSWAGYYAHPERPVTVDDPTCMGRNYYGRASAPDVVGEEEAEERDAALADMASLKTWAGFYAHPERPVATDDTATARSYYSRLSAAPHDDEEEADEKDQILKDMAMLKELAGWYKHPERPVKRTDPFATGRNYFSRPSAPEYDDVDEEIEKDLILKEAAQLKQIAGWYKHPERPVECTDPFATGRNYFNRASASALHEDEDLEHERDLILSEMAELKKFASWYMHPEQPVKADSEVFGRNYFSRPSAEEYDEDLSAEREQVLADAAELKKTASWFLHPEKPVVTTDPCAVGRNYFSRPSAPEYESFDEEYDRDMVFSDLAQLKQLAIDWRHPEKGVVTTDPCATGRNYFTRPSGLLTESPEDDEERTRVLEEAAALKKLATDFLHREIPVTSSVAVGRDFFSRPSAPEYEDAELKDQHDAIIADAKNLKDFASWYHHPETGLSSSVAVTRDFFTRPSATDADVSPEDEEEKALILADALALKKLAVDYAHPEKPVVSKINCVRNYFNRPSAEGHSDYIHTQGHAIENDAAEEHHNVDFHHYHYYDHHHHDDDHSHHTHQSDHFEMDEDMFHGFRESLYAAHAAQEQLVPIIKEEKEEEGGKLSRSPSSVMLFDQEAM